MWYHICSRDPSRDGLILLQQIPLGSLPYCESKHDFVAQCLPSRDECRDLS